MYKIRNFWRANMVVCCVLGPIGISQSASAQSTVAWIWTDGSGTVSQPGNYGQLRIPSSGNIPPGRWNTARWSDNSGNLWMFGGSGYAATTNETGLLLNDLWEFSPSSSEWVWMGGSGTTESQSPGVYGKLSMPAIQDIPGSRTDAVNWTDHNGNFWLFGGSGCDERGDVGQLNDLWEYDTAINEWIWMSGSSVIGQPGTYGTLGMPATENIPGGRNGAVSWVDHNGDLWLFGGDGYDANGLKGFLNDLWRFDLSSNEWTWMGGSRTITASSGQPGIYGTLGIPFAGNVPGGRVDAVSWTDHGGNFWLFGGSGYDAKDNLTTLNDLWEFTSSTNEWEWVSGSATSTGCDTYNLGIIICGGEPGVYGTLGTTSVGNMPGGRSSVATWIDQDGNFWLFGGQGYDSAGNEGNLNDFWKFNPNSNEWTWISGNSTEAGCSPLPEGNIFCNGQPGTYGMLGVAGMANNPGARFGALGWMDNKDNMWLFGGYGSDSVGNTGVLSDLWKYQQATPALPDFSILASPGSLIVTDGKSGSSTVTISPMNGFSAAISLSCSGLPPGASCMFTPASVTPQSTPISTALTVTTSAATASVVHNSGQFLSGTFAVLLCCLSFRKRRTLPFTVALLVIFGFGLSLLCGCGSSLSSRSTTAIMTVIATSGSLQHSTTLTLTVE